MLSHRKRQTNLQNEIHPEEPTKAVKKPKDDIIISSGSSNIECVLEDTASAGTKGKIKNKPRASSRQKCKKIYEERPLNSVRYDSTLPHLPQYGEERVRCKLEMCGSAKTNIFCTTCNVHLCTNKNNCFKKFHELNIPEKAIKANKST